MAAASDVPGVFDVIVNGEGYLVVDSQDQRARYGYSKTFLDRTNVGAAYGDNAQDFFLTVSQVDWSLGSAQRYFRTTDEDRRRRYWDGTNADPASIPGQVTIRTTMASLTFGFSVRAATEHPGGIYAAGTTNLASVSSSGTITDVGAHGLGAAPSQWGIASDTSNIFLSTTAAGTVGVRKWSGSAFSTFSATGADSLAFLNNTLYGYRESTATLIRYDTSGNATTIFTWKDAAGAALTGSAYATRLRPFGGKLLFLRSQGVRRPAELWQYDGTNVSQLAEFPANLVPGELEVVSGVAFVSGYLNRNADKRPAIFYYVNSTTGKLWESNVSGYTNATSPAMCAYGDGLAFTDDTTGKLMQYNIAAGGVHAMGGYTVTNATPMMAGNKDVLVHTRNSTTGYIFPTASVAASATIITSLYDFENALTKDFRGIKVDADVPTGATFDIAYQTDSADGSFTTLQSGAAAGTEYTLTGVSGRSITIRITLNKGSSAAGPTLKRVYVRASPRLQQFRRVEWLLNCSGRDGKAPLELRNGRPHAKDGQSMAIDLRTAISSSSPISITDRFGTFTGVLEPEHCELVEVRPEEFIARIRAREV